jgi:hypothetical protein
MKLYQIQASNWQTFFGTAQNIIERDVTIIAQTPSNDAFLLLSKDAQDGLALKTSVPSGFDFTYCQEWGLTINDAIVDRVILDLRRKEYGKIGDQLDLLYKDMLADKGNKSGEWFKHIKAVKDANPKK